MAIKRISLARKDSDPTREKAGPKRKQKREAIVRMYRQGLGDCFLITLPREPEPFQILLDCGALKSRHYDDLHMRAVVNDIIGATTRVRTSRGGISKYAQLDVVAVTHEHWDHISGFIQAQELFDTVTVNDVWVAWTEEPGNEVAQQLKTQFKKKKIAVEKALALMSQSHKDDERMGLYRKAISELFGFFGEFGAAPAAGVATLPRTTEAAWEYILGKGKKTYCNPRQRPLEIEGVEGVRVYILGPPNDPNFIRKKVSTRETYQQGWRNTLSLSDSFLAAVAGDDISIAGENMLDIKERAFPFGPNFRIPREEARRMSFFQHSYGFEAGEDDWRRIDDEWLTLAGELALHLDNYTNNTCLAFAIELGESGKVLLFPGDAQVGNWLSWSELTWDVETSNGGFRTVKTDDLLARTVLYKVGHHGSHNATLSAKGVEKMESPELVAMIPVHRATAQDQGWEFPYPPLWERLKEKASGRVLLADTKDIDEIADEAQKRLSPNDWQKFKQSAKFTPLYVEYRIPF